MNSQRTKLYETQLRCAFATIGHTQMHIGFELPNRPENAFQGRANLQVNRFSLDGIYVALGSVGRAYAAARGAA